ncbi:hypothetical protein Nepgr_014656 [Nepenthes gracilis]|uniref:Bifunctional inhibitor/plant lipid transfer protein/seed storage helical domain-containing protein n=1 Tax=Nepenthes gracilis TaxID=150966 RepID=A0AAD3SJN3_NEPGR|nr:hypothetical protein Nepgr_014656 [Nepenthes gracilis]
MGSKFWYALVVVVSMAAGLASSDDLDKAKQECTSQLLVLSPCLDYVSGSGDNAKAPTMDCCSAIKQVLKSSKRCVCLLFEFKDDPNLGIQINFTTALGLPSACHSNDSLSECPAILHLPPNSPEAKMFNDYARKEAGTTSSPSPGASAASSDSNSGSKGSSTTPAAVKKNNGGHRMGWSGALWIVYGVTVTLAVCCI